MTLFVIQEAEHIQQLLQHINTQDPHIQFTMEEPDHNGSLPFLDTWVSPGPNNTLMTTVYRKPTHTDQYLHWDSNHFIVAKHSVLNTLAQMAKVVSTTQQAIHKELEHIGKALQACHFPPWMLNKLQQKFECRKPTHTDQYLHWDSNHFIVAKHSVLNTFAQMAIVVSTTQQAIHKELEHIGKALQACHFPPWMLNKLQQKFECKHSIDHGLNSRDNQSNHNISSGTNSSSNHRIVYIVVLYIQGLWEGFKRTCNNKGIQVYFKGTNTIKTLLMAPKDRDNKLQKSVVIYKFKCPHIKLPQRIHWRIW